MGAIDSISSFLGLGRLGRYLPEPVGNIAGGFKAILDQLGGATAPLEGGSKEEVLSNLMAAQIAEQQKMQVISLYSNVSKSEHEANMAPIRNIRVG